MNQIKLTFLFTVLLSMVGLRAYAEWDTSKKVPVDGLYYYLDKEKHKAQVAPGGYPYDEPYNYKEGYHLIIPSEFTINMNEYYSVTSIGEKAFRGCSGLTSIEIPNSVTSIGTSAFSRCSGLTSIEIPNSVTSIGDYAFSSCSSLPSITIPSSVTSIGQAAFRNCSSLTSINVNENNVYFDSRMNCNAIIATFDNRLIAGCKNTVVPNSVTSIGDAAFQGCLDLTSIEIPNSVTSIGDYVFDFCWRLTSIKIGNSLTSIGKNAFSDCYSLTKVTINSNTIVSPNYSSSSSLKSIFGAQVKEYIIGDEVQSIGDHAFDGCTDLTSFTIGNGVVSIGIYAFNNCPGLTTVTINNNSIVSRNRDNTYNSKSIFESAFGPQVTKYIIGNEVQRIGNYAFHDCTALTSVAIPNSVSNIGKSAFAGCSGLTSITIPNSVISIDESAFAGCSDLKKVIVPDIAAWCGIKFGNETSNPLFNAHLLYRDEDTEITDLKIPNSVTSIGSYVFYGCSGLTSIEIPNIVTSIGDCAFSGCENLTSVDVKWDSPIKISSEVFTNRTNATLHVPQGCVDAYKAADYWKEFKKIKDAILLWDNNVKDICLANWDKDNDGELSSEEAAAVTDLGTVFKGNTKITEFNELKYFTSLTSIGDGAFQGCSNLNQILFPNSLNSIGNEAFKGCLLYDIKITIPNGVTYIGNEAFKGCHIISIAIPNSVTSIGDYAFSECDDMTSVAVKWENPIKITSDVFTNRANVKLHVPHGRIDTYKAADYWKEFKGIFENIVFADANVKALCQYFDEDEDGEVATDEAAAVTGFDFTKGPLFKGKANITSFDELRYFTGLTSIGYSYFSGCTSLTSITIPNNVTSIGNNAFYDCSSLTSITIPNSVNSIGDNAFSNCSSLINVVVQNRNPVKITSEVFTNRANATLHVPQGCVDTYKAADYWKEFMKIKEASYIVFADENVKALCLSFDEDGDGEVDIEEAAAVPDFDFTKGPLFKGRTNITSFDELRYFTGLTSIGDSYFSGCTSLTSITIPNNVTSIGNNAFYGCSSLNSVKVYAMIPPTTGNNVFPTDNHAITLYVPRGSKAAYETANVWKDFSSIVEFDVDNYGLINDIFYEYNGDEAIVVANPNKYQGNVVIPVSVNYNGKEYRVTSIGNNAFNGCSGLTSITIPNSVTSIGQDAFFDCSGIKTIDIPNSVTSIGMGAFTNCYGLTSFRFPNQLRTIAVNMLANCDVTSIIIPASVKTIEQGAFVSCWLLKDVYCLATDVPTADDLTFNNVTTSNVTLHVYSESVNAYSSANVWSSLKVVALTPDEIAALLTIKGDANGDGEINVSDVVEIVNYIMNKPSDKFVFAAADLNGDAEVNIGDVILNVKNILSQSNSGANSVSRRASTMCDFAQYTAAQFELKVNKNASIMDIRLVGSMAQSHQLMYEQKDDNTYAVVVYSLSNQLMKPENGRIVDTETAGGDLTMQNITVATPSGETHYYQSNGTITGIYKLENDSKSAVIYDLKGNRLNGKILEKGIYIVNGKKVVVK